MHDFKKIIGFGSILLALCSGFALAHEDRHENPVEELSTSFSRMVVTGKVAYQSRFTRVVDAECGNTPCKKSEVYWSLVIQTEKAQYLLNKKLNVGKSRSPLVTEVGGVPVRPGSIVRIEGDMVDYGSNLYSIQKVHHVDLVMDLGWACYNMGGDGPNVYARVWRDFQNNTAIDDNRSLLGLPSQGVEQEASSSGEAQVVYKMRIQEVFNRTIRPIAFINDVDFAVRSNQWVFAGVSTTPNEASVELQISEAPVDSVNVPAKLKITKDLAHPLTLGLPESSQSVVIEMSCSRTRTALF